jgi:nicotinate dehydrogenase subunit A
MSRVTELKVNGGSWPVDADAGQPLLSVLRDDLGLTGCKIGCGEGECGVCTVLVDDQAVRSCITPVGNVAHRRICTVEGLEQAGKLHPLQQAFLDVDALQCGYCTPGMIMSALDLLTRCPDPSAATMKEAMQGNICRCGAYPRIVEAIHRAAAELRATATPGGGR